jgi:trimeric autotransporter adhesin
MNRPNPFSSATLHHVASLISRSPLRLGVLLIPLVVAFFALSPTAEAVNPPPDGGCPDGNTAEGDGALANLTTGGSNTAIGFDALFSLTNNHGNTAIGAKALQNNIGGFNTANGFVALYNNTTGSYNMGNGAFALRFNTTGNTNTASGYAALYANTTGSNNTADGVDALENNIIGNNNTATGDSTLNLDTTGNSNTASGYDALYTNTTGSNNTASWVNALLVNTKGSNNTAVGVNALANSRTGSSNIALGYNAGANITSFSNNIDIGNVGVAGEANKIRIGTVGTQNGTFIAGISGTSIANGVGVMVNANGKLGTVVSSARFKEAIKPMDKASEAILSLQPVAFRYKHDLDPDGIPQFGLVAEQVEKVNPDLVVRGEDGRVMTVRYEAVNAMLLNEFLKEHKKVQKLESTVTKQESDFKATLAEQQRQIESLTATVQKVSDQIALSKPSPQLVANP